MVVVVVLIHYYYMYFRLDIMHMYLLLYPSSYQHSHSSYPSTLYLIIMMVVLQLQQLEEEAQMNLYLDTRLDNSNNNNNNNKQQQQQGHCAPSVRRSTNLAATYMVQKAWSFVACSAAEEDQPRFCAAESTTTARAATRPPVDACHATPETVSGEESTRKTWVPGARRRDAMPSAACFATTPPMMAQVGLGKSLPLPAVHVRPHFRSDLPPVLLLLRKSCCCWHHRWRRFACWPAAAAANSVVAAAEKEKEK